MSSHGKSGLSPKQKRKLKRYLGFIDEQSRQVGRVSGKGNGSRGVLKDRQDDNLQRLNTHSKTSTNDSANMG